LNYNTCSQVIGLARELEERASAFYQELAQKLPQPEGDLFRGYAQENSRLIGQVERAYYGVISDAFEGCFSFDINPSDYAFQTEAGPGYAAALSQALQIEEKLLQFDTDAAAQSKSLMADIPRAFSLVARKRNSRIEELKTLSAKASGS
jgi:hypothetical protein